MNIPATSYFQYRCRTISTASMLSRGYILNISQQPHISNKMQDHYSNSKGITNLAPRDHLHKISNGNNDKSASPNASIETDITKRSSSLILASKADKALSNPMYDLI
jgi:hypothetical protein